MDKSINERIKQLATANGGNVSRFAAKIGVSQPTLSSVVKGEYSPSFDTLDKILHLYPNLSAEWLMRGEGPMSRNESVVKDGNEESTNEEIIRLQNIIASLTEIIANK